MQTRCREIALGPAREAALACDDARLESREIATPGGRASVFRVVSRAVVSVVRGGRVRTLLDAPHRYEALDPVEAEGPLFSLRVEVPAACGEIALREPSDGACARSKRADAAPERPPAAADDERAALRPWREFDRRLRDRICVAARSYAWSGGALRPR